MSFNIKKQFNRQATFNILLLLFIVSFPIGYKLNTWLLYLFIIIFFVDTKESLRIKWSAIKTCKIILAYWVFFAAQLIGIFYSQDLDEAIKNVVQLLPLIFLPGIFMCELPKANREKTFKIIKVAVPITFVLIALYYRFFLKYEGMDRFVQIVYINTLGISQFYIIFILFLPFFLIINDLKSRNIYQSMALMTLISYFVILMNNFTGILFLIITLFIAFKEILKLSSKKLSLILISLGIVSIIASIILVSNKFERKFEPLKYTSFQIDNIKTKNKYAYTRNTLEHRMYIHYLVLTDLKNTTPFGVGTGDTQTYLNNLYLENNFLTGIKLELNAHSQYIQEYLKTGIISLLAFIFMIYTLIKYTIKNNVLYTYYVMFFAIACLVESYLNRYHGIIICAGIIPILIFYSSKKHTKPK